MWPRKTSTTVEQWPVIRAEKVVGEAIFGGPRGLRMPFWKT